MKKLTNNELKTLLKIAGITHGVAFLGILTPFQFLSVPF